MFGSRTNQHLPMNAADMDSDFELQWRQARTHENQGRPGAAKAIYEALLRADPQRLYVRLRLSAIAQGEGHYRAARDHALACAELVRHSRWNDLGAVTRRLLTFDEQRLVAELIMGADWTHPDIVKSSAVLSQHLWLIDHVREALELIDVVSARSLPSHLLSYSKANALRYFGRMEEATDEYEKCLALRPDFPYAHWSLASHRKSSPPRARIGRIQKAQAAYAPDAEEQAYLHYALFKEYDNAGDVDLAWSSLMAGARLKRASLRYDAQAEEAGYAALQDQVTAAFAGSASATDQERIPVFIVGLPRTGTTLLERILGGHSQVAAGGELNDFGSALSLASDRFLGNYLTAETVRQLGAVDFAEVGRTYLARTSQRTRGRRFLTDKNPVNFAYAGYVAKALPQARILCLRRNAMDACLSNLKELFASDAYAYSYDLGELADHYLRFERLCEHWKQVMPDRFFEVGYEELVSDPSRMVEDVMSFCGLPFEPECLDITRNQAPVATASSSQVRQPINASSVEAWRRYGEHLEPLQRRLGPRHGSSHVTAHA